MILRTKAHESPVAVELGLTVAEEVVVVVLIEAEAVELVDHQLHTQMARAKRMWNNQFLSLTQAHGTRSLLRQMRHLHLGTLLRSLLSLLNLLSLLSLLRKALLHGVPLLLQLLQASHRASFQTVLRRAGQACLRSLPPPQHQRHLSQLRSMFSCPISIGI